MPSGGADEADPFGAVHRAAAADGSHALEGCHVQAGHHDIALVILEKAGGLRNLIQLGDPGVEQDEA